MKNVRVLLFGLIVLFISIESAVKAQNLVTLHDTIDSKILGEKRTIDVILPENYKQNPDIKYDVIYVLDGEYNTKFVSQIYEYLANWGIIPKNIIVSISHNNIKGINLRTRDLIPQHDGQTVSGKADSFLSFLKNELVSYINKEYPTTGENLLFGHSLGGSFAIYALITEPQLFNTYIAADPALWSDEYYISNLASERLNNIPENKALFMSGKGDHYMGVNALDSIITAINTPGFYYKCMIYLDETHRTIGLKSIYDGLKFAYNGYGANIGFTPNSGILLKNKPLKIWGADETNGLNIRYTVDGSEPTISSPKFEGMDISEPMNLKIKLFSETGRFDKTLSGKFDSGKVLPAISEPFGIIPGRLNFKYYKGEWSRLPEFNNLKPDSSGFIGYVKDEEGIFNIKNHNNGACLLNGYVEIKEDGYYGFFMNADNIAKLFISDKLIITSDKKVDYQSFVLPLQKGFYPLRLEYITKKEGNGVYLCYYKQFDALLCRPIPSELLYSIGESILK